MVAKALVGIAHLELFALGLIGLGLGDEAVVEHALDDVELARAGPLGVADGVVSRGRFGQPREHGRFGHGDGLQGFAKIGLAGGGKSVGAVA